MKVGSMNAWQEYGPKARKYLGTSLPPQEIKRGDMITGWELAPWMVIESAPVPHPTHEGWFTYEAATAHGVGSYVLTDGETLSVGRIPLTNTDRGAYGSLLGKWTAPCGCVVNKGEHCKECGPYNGASPLCVNRAHPQAGEPDRIRVRPCGGRTQESQVRGRK